MPKRDAMAATDWPASVAVLATAGIDRQESAGADHLPALRRNANVGGVGGHGWVSRLVVRGPLAGLRLRPEDAVLRLLPLRARRPKPAPGRRSRQGVMSRPLGDRIRMCAVVPVVHVQFIDASGLRRIAGADLARQMEDDDWPGARPPFLIQVVCCETRESRPMTKPLPEWQAHSASDYDGTMTARCGPLLAEIVEDPGRRQAILVGPRDLHRKLFASFTPTTHPEYAGTYRGTPDTSLADRKILAKSQIKPGTEYEFCLPGEVPSRMTKLQQDTVELLLGTDADDYDKLIALAYTFCWFGKIHPFLDGNGHVQRAVFAVMATEFGFPLSLRFAIHPRPYDRLLAIALETFTRAPVGEECGEVSLVAEYLGFCWRSRKSADM